jgi:hypothetical protein
MGKLAERFTDATRSGVYRVRRGDIPRTAAGEAQAHLVEVSVAALADGGWPRVQRALSEAQARICVLLVPDAGSLARAGHAGLLAKLRAAAQERRDAGRSFFVVLVDPDQQLDAPLLYHETVVE